MSYIKVEGLTKKYTIISKKTKKEIYALDNLFLQVKKGEFMGYIGPNGAGKSTTIKVLTGIMVPSSGMVSVDGLCPWKDRKEHVRKIGAVFGQKTQMWWDLPVIDTYNLLRDIFRISKTKYTQQLSYILENLDLQELLEKPVRFLSLGQRMRAEIGACLIHDPD
ncbi:MAG TPA: ATP-binding cassette domain-containing protein, partial [Petrotogaceae bacterium]|nr:ATP-binding cassette domain-containing protein [Petrotogaceae bacterium]